MASSGVKEKETEDWRSKNLNNLTNPKSACILTWY